MVRALKSAGDSRVGAVVLATTTPDYLCPVTAPDGGRTRGTAQGPPAMTDIDFTKRP
jgi:3-oxoacyl-[acyl-carrier-protein] synthase-3